MQRGDQVIFRSAVGRATPPVRWTVAHTFDDGDARIVRKARVGVETQTVAQRDLLIV